MNRIGHPNIVDVFAFGALSDGRSYMAMKWLAGGSLAARLVRGPLLLETPSPSSPVSIEAHRRRMDLECSATRADAGAGGFASGASPILTSARR